MNEICIHRNEILFSVSYICVVLVYLVQLFIYSAISTFYVIGKTKRKHHEKQKNIYSKDKTTTRNILQFCRFYFPHASRLHVVTEDHLIFYREAKMINLRNCRIRNEQCDIGYVECLSV